MSRFISLVAVLLATSGSSSAGPKEDATQVTEKWIAAFNARDLDGIVSLHARDALFFGTSSRALAVGQSDIRRYFEQVFGFGARIALKEHSVVALSETAAVVAGLDDVSGGTGRVSFVIGRTDEGWRIFHFHRSSRP